MQSEDQRRWQLIPNYPGPIRRYHDDPRNLPVLDNKGMPLVDAVYAGRGTRAGHLATEESVPQPGRLLSPDEQADVARISRVMGPLRRAWEYPALLDQFRADPMGYLTASMIAIPGAPSAPLPAPPSNRTANDPPAQPPYVASNNIADAEYQQLLDQQVRGSPQTIRELITTARNGSQQRAAEIVLELLQDLEYRYQLITPDCK